MNRAERRKAGVKRTEPVYTVTREQLAVVKKKAEEDAIEKLLVLMLGLPIMEN